MKIGHLTFHGAHNYGSVLQAYALSKQIELMGNEVEIINLRNKAQLEAYEIIHKSDKGYRRAFKYLIFHSLKRRFNEFERFINEVLPVSEEQYLSTQDIANANLEYDAYVCGGDQIWNPACQDFEPAYYLQFLPETDTAKRISYSPSLGKTEFDESTKKNIANWISNFQSISVREERGAQLLRTLTDKPVQVVCDPVLLLDMKYWQEMAVAPKYKKPYILTYFLDNNHGSRNLIEYLRKTTGYEVVILNEYIRDFVKPYHKVYDASPEEFVGLFMNASFIYTNSFHGTAFATIFEKPFLTAIAADQEHAVNNNDSRKIDYLRRIGLEDRLYTNGLPDRESLLHVDYKTANDKLIKFREESLNYLVEAL